MEKNPHTLNVASIANLRELGGFPVAGGGTTKPHRFLRCADTTGVTTRDVRYLKRYGLARVVDLRGDVELRNWPDPFAHKLGISYLSVPLHDLNLHDPKLEVELPEDAELDFADFLIEGYLDMLANRPAVQRIFSFFAEAKEHECVLFHCAAGMDRTGVTAMLLLGLAGVDRDHIAADYSYSFGDEDEVDALVAGELTPDDASSDPLRVAPDVMRTVYDQLCSAYGDVASYLRACRLTDEQLDAVRAHLLA